MWAAFQTSEIGGTLALYHASGRDQGGFPELIQHTVSKSPIAANLGIRGAISEKLQGRVL